MGRLYEQGLSAYDFANLERELRVSGLIPNALVPPILPLAPPFLLPLVGLLAKLDFADALLIFSVSSIGLVALSLRVLSRLMPSSFQSLYSSTGALAVLSFSPLWKMILIGQVSSVVLLGISLALLCFINSRWTALGASLALMLMKPTLCIGAWATFFSRSGSRVGLVIGVMIASMLLASTLGFQFFPVSAQYLDALKSSLETTRSYPQPTINAILPSALRGALDPISSVGLLLLGLCAGACGTREIVMQRILGLILPLSCLFSPYLWAHDLVLLMPSYLCIWLNPKTSRGTRLLMACTNILWLSDFLATGREQWALALPLLILWLYWRKQNRRLSALGCRFSPADFT